VSRSRLVRDVRDLLRARSWATSCQLIMVSQSRSLVRSTSVIKRSPSHSLGYSLVAPFFFSLHFRPWYPKCAYKIVVAVPTKNRLAFSPPDFEGCTLTSFAGGRCSGRVFPGEKSRVGGCSAFGSIVRDFISQHTLESPVSVSLEGPCNQKDFMQSQTVERKIAEMAYHGQNWCAFQEPGFLNVIVMTCNPHYFIYSPAQWPSWLKFSARGLFFVAPVI
jgi:hypothetical protein